MFNVEPPNENGGTEAAVSAARQDSANAEIVDALSEVRQELIALRKEMKKPEQEPVEENTARTLFALVKELHIQGRWRKAPVLQVFRLYCLDGLSANEVARRCACSKALVVLRLEALRKKLGRDPAELRQLSDHFERIADSLSDSRARRVNRQSAIDEGPAAWGAED